MSYDIRESYRATVTNSGVTTSTDYDTLDLLNVDISTNTTLYPAGVAIVVDKIVKTYTRYAVYNIPGGDPLPVNTVGSLAMDRSSYTKNRVSVKGGV